MAAEQDRFATGDPYSFQKHSYLSRIYMAHLNRYEALFPREQMLILRSEDLFTISERIWLVLLRFLQLKPITWPGALPRANAGEGLGDHVDPALRQKLRQQMAETVAGVRSRYGIEWDWM